MKITAKMLGEQLNLITALCYAEISKAIDNDMDKEELKKLQEFTTEINHMASKTKEALGSLEDKDLSQIYLELKDSITPVDNSPKADTVALDNQRNAVSHVCLTTMIATVVVTNNIDDINRLSNTVGKIMQEASMTSKLHDIHVDMSLAEVATKFGVDYSEWYSKDIQKANDLFNSTTIQKTNELMKHLASQPKQK